MYKLVSEIEDSRWSFLNGEMIFGNIVWLSNKKDAYKYTLLDKDGNKMDINVNDYIVDDGYN